MIASLFALVFAVPASAQCPALKDAQTLLDCALANDPAVREAESRQAQAAAGLRLMGQRPNPELETKGTWGNGASQVEVDLVQALEVGG